MGNKMNNFNKGFNSFGNTNTMTMNTMSSSNFKSTDQVNFN